MAWKCDLYLGEEMQNLAIIGYGKMGKMIESMAGDYGFEIVSRIDPQLGTEICKQDLAGAEFAIEFTQPDSAFGNIVKCLDLGVKAVCGTTGWFDKLSEIYKLVEKKKGSLVYGANFSIGMNLFYRIIELSAAIMNNQPLYDAYGYELHHRYKQDSPSGTARQLGNILIEKLDRKEKLVFESLQRKRSDNELHFASVRGGEIPGEHRIGFDSEFDTIELKHTARNRRGLAAGALLAARFLSDKEGIYNFKDIAGEL